MVWSCERENDLHESIKCREYCDLLNEYWVTKKDYAARS